MNNSNKAYLVAIILLVVSVGVLAFRSLSSDHVSIAYVDTNRLLDSYQAMLDARRTYQREKDEWNSNLNTLALEADKAAQKLSHLSTATAPAIRSACQNEAKIKQQQFSNYRTAIAQQEPDEQKRLTEPVLSLVNKHLRVYAKSKGYDVIIASADSGAILYANSNLDVTSDVAAQLNKALRDSLSITKPVSLR